MKHIGRVQVILTLQTVDEKITVSGNSHSTFHASEDAIVKLYGEITERRLNGIRRSSTRRIPALRKGMKVRARRAIKDDPNGHHVIMPGEIGKVDSVHEDEIDVVFEQRPGLWICNRGDLEPIKKQR